MKIKRSEDSEHYYNADNICDRLQENWAQRGVRKYREKIDRFL